MLLDDHNQNIESMNHDHQRTDSLINETQRLFDDYQRRLKLPLFVRYEHIFCFSIEKKQVCNDAIKADESIINDMERRLTRSKRLSDQEEILQILQQHVPSKCDSNEYDQ